LTSEAVSSQSHGPRNLGAWVSADAPVAKTALVDLGASPPRSWSYGELRVALDAVRAVLVGQGLEPGDRVAVSGPNSADFVIAVIAAMQAGCVAMPFTHKLPLAQRAETLRSRRAVLWLHDERTTEAGPHQERLQGLADHAVALHAPPVPIYEPEPGSLAMILHTSGSTGAPRGVRLPHASQVWAMERCFDGAEPVGAHHRRLVAAPLAHMNASFTVQYTLAAGATAVLMPGFQAAAYAQAIHTHRITALSGVPTMLVLLLRELEAQPELDTSSVEVVTTGSAPATQALLDAVQARFGRALIDYGYGTTEGGPVPFGPHPRGLPKPLLSIGCTTPGVQAELRGGASPDEGELFLKSPMTMDGYDGEPERTSAVLQDGWYRTGDRLRRDADGFHWFVGRVDDMFTVGGHNVWPAAVEKLLETMPGVAQALVVPVDDEVKGAVPWAFVVRTGDAAGAALSAEAVQQHALAQGPAYAHPRRVEFVEHIRLGHTHKPDRAWHRARAAALAKDATA
jgi:acyl-coenzyme A synthetase/AMP-(fatty) acid ligase